MVTEIDRDELRQKLEHPKRWTLVEVLPENDFHRLPYKEIDLNASWESFDLKHELTDQGIRRFIDDYNSTLKSAA